MKSLLSTILVMLPLLVFAQPTFIGTMLPNGLYQTYNLNDLGDFRQVRLQATSSAGSNSRIWEFATGNYFENWRAYTFPTTLAGFNQTINPATEASSARYNSGFGGASSWLPPITASNYYTINVTEFAPPTNQFMAILETSYNPATINTVSLSGATVANTPVQIDITLSSNPAAGEFVYVRYSTDGFASSNFVIASFTGNTGSAMIPGLPNNTIVSFYVFSSSVGFTQMGTEVGANGDPAYNMLALNLNNNGSANYSYTVAASVPVEFSSITTTKDANGIGIKWETATESNNSHFIIEKSIDGKNWSKIKQVLGKGTSLKTSRYNILDAAPSTGLNYYRVKQVDFDGTFAYSEIVSERWTQNIELKIFPNPTSDVINLIGMPPTQEVQIQISNPSGQTIIQEKWQGDPIYLSNFNPGVYLLKVLAGEQVLKMDKIVVR